MFNGKVKILCTSGHFPVANIISNFITKLAHTSIYWEFQNTPLGNPSLTTLSILK